LREGRHCRTSNAGTYVLKDFAIGIAVFQRTAGEGGRPFASTRFRSMAALAGAVEYLAASLARTRAAGERVLLGLGDVLLREEEAKTRDGGGEEPREAVSKQWKNPIRT
jgi:hypothetical protein